MDPERTEPTLEDGLQKVMATLPPVVKDYVVNEKYTPVAQALMSQYKLRIDQGGVLERELLLLLMGVETPDEFVEALVTEADIDNDTVDKIARDVNTRIFIPLRAEEIRASAQKPTPPAPRPVASDSGTHFHLQNKIPLPQQQPTQPPQASRVAPKHFDSGHMLEDHEEPHIEFKKAPLPPPNLPGQPPQNASAPAPRAVPLGGHPNMMPSETPKPAALPQPAGLKFSPPIMPSTKPIKYDVDPYRESIDEADKG